ncbi:MAG: thiol reductase thioredoxin [Pelagibacteraceae bacterium]|nr:thiol reductase thioredoxin [Pelagibacteraceae bacterium]
MKKILIIIFFLFCSNSLAIEESTTFTDKIFKKAQSEGKIIVINSWNKFCSTCKKQIKILDQAETKFNDVIFLSYEQTENKDIANKLSIDYWTTIVIYKGEDEIYRSMGVTEKNQLYLAIEKILKNKI